MDYCYLRFKNNKTYELSLSLFKMKSDLFYKLGYRPKIKVSPEGVNYAAFDTILSLWGKQLTEETELVRRYVLAYTIIKDILPYYESSLPESVRNNPQRDALVGCVSSACQDIIEGYQQRAKGLFDDLKTWKFKRVTPWTVPLFSEEFQSTLPHSNIL